MLANLLCEFQARNPELHVALHVFDTQTIVERVAARELELGVVGAGRRHRGVVFEPFLHDEVILACPPGHPFAGRTVTLDEIRAETLIVMQEGAGVRQMIEDELRRVGMRLRDLDVRLELGLQESVITAVKAGYGVTFISSTSVEADLAAGTLAAARVEGLELERDIYLVRSSGRAETRARPRLPRVRARTQRRAMIVRWSLGELPAVLEELGLARPLLVASERWDALDLPHAARWSEIPSDRIEVPAEADSLLAVGGGSAIDTAHHASAEQRPAGRVGADDVLRRRVDAHVRRALARPPHRRRRRRREPRGDRLRRRAHARPAACRDGRHRAERARALRRGALRAGPKRRRRRARALTAPR